MSFKANRVDLNIEFAHMSPSEALDIPHLFKDLEDEIYLTRELVKGAESSDKTYCLTLLVDDINDPQGPDVIVNWETVRQEFAKLGLLLDHILYESKLSTVGDSLLSLLARMAKTKGAAKTFSVRSRDLKMLRQIEAERPLDLLFRGGLSRRLAAPTKQWQQEVPHDLVKTAVVLSFNEKGDEPVTRYTCVTLATCWHLARLGVQPFKNVAELGMRFSEKPFIASNAISILPLEYLAVESHCLQVIRAIPDPAISSLWQNIQYHFVRSRYARLAYM